MTGVSYMIPFVAAGGLLIALGFALGGFDIALAPGSPGGRTCEQLTWLSAADCAAATEAGTSIGSLAISAGWSAGFGNYMGARKIAHRGPQNYHIDPEDVAAF